MLSTVVPFFLHGVAGEIEVRIEPNPYPIDWLDHAGRRASGTEWDEAWARQFPACTAVIRHDSAGYAAMCGWVQLVMSTDSDAPGIFEMDPTPVTAGLDLPYCWFGTTPTLFDGPSRDSHADLTWRARSFLCASPGPMSHAVEPLAAFRWGFDVRDGRVSHVRPAAIPLECWGEHAGLLERSYPSWTFLPAPRSAVSAQGRPS